MGLFGKSFAEQVDEALADIEAMNLGVAKLGAEINDRVVTLTGMAPDLKVKTRVMEEFNARVDSENTINLIRVVEIAEERDDRTVPLQRPDRPQETVPMHVVPEEERTTERIYEVVAGDTLGAIAQRFYGNAGKYMKIFEANRDILDNPDLIKVGQRLRIPD
jgi:nucleoid-associated protein YgaU